MPVSSGLPASEGIAVVETIVGRADVLGAVDRALDDVRAGELRVVEVVGDPGMGKTTVVNAVRQRAQRQGFAVLTGRATEYEREPFAAFADALCDHPIEAALTWSPRFRAGEAGATAELDSFVRAIRPLVDGPFAGVVVLLDDMHWADDHSMALIRQFHWCVGVPVLLVVAYRPRQLADRHAAALDGMSRRDSRWHRITLAPLTPADVVEFCGDTASSVRHGSLHAAGEGNPRYILALKEMPPADPSIGFGDRDAVHDVLPRPFSTAVLNEMAGLSQLARMALNAAAVLGEAFPSDLVAPVAETEPAAIPSALAELLGRDLIRVTDSASWFQFRHPLLRAVVYAATGSGWRLGAHARAAGLLARRAVPPAALANHIGFVTRTDGDEAPRILLRAAEQLSPVAPERAAHWLRRALALVPDHENERPRLALRLAGTLATAGQLQESRDVLHDVLDCHPGGPDRSHAVATLVRVYRLLGRQRDARALLQQENVSDPGRRAEPSIELEQAASHLYSHNAPAAVAPARRALTSAADNPSGGLDLTAAAALAMTRALQSTDARAAADLDSAVALIDQAQDGELAGQLESIVAIGWTETFHERHEGARRHFRRGLKLARLTGQGYVLAELLVGLAHVTLLSGGIDDAGRYADEALGAAVRTGNEDLHLVATAMGVSVRTWRGDLRDALHTAVKSAEGLEQVIGRGPSNCLRALAEARWRNGDGAGARAAILDAGGGPELPFLQATVRAYWFRLLTQADAAEGNLDGATQWAQRAERTATASGLAGQRGQAVLAQAAVLTGADGMAGAATAARAATEAFAAAGMPLAEAEANMAAGAACAALGDRAAAMDALGRAEALFAMCGAEQMRRKAGRERLDGDSAFRDRHGPGGKALRSLTDRQRQIAVLVAQGHTNREIGQRLFMSPKTVEYHLARTFAKLDVPSRAALSSLVATGAFTRN